MIDASVIGKAGLIIQYEDVISLLGYNIAEYLRDNKVNDKFDRMSHEDILLSYINREHESINQWFKDEFDYDLDYTTLGESRIMCKPNMCYAYKVFQESVKNGITNLIIYSNQYFKAIDDYKSSFNIKSIQYHHGDIVDLLNDNPNCTFITNNSESISKCVDVKAPFVLTIADDFVYIRDVLSTGVTSELVNQNKLVFYTGILSGGITNIPRDT